MIFVIKHYLEKENNFRNTQDTAWYLAKLHYQQVNLPSFQMHFIQSLFVFGRKHGLGNVLFALRELGVCVEPVLLPVHHAPSGRPGAPLETCAGIWFCRIPDKCLLSTRDVHYGTFRGSGIFISNPEYRTLFRNNLLEQNELIAHRFRTSISDHTICWLGRYVIMQRR